MAAAHWSCTTRPASARVTLVRCLVRIWRGAKPACPTTTFSEDHNLAPPRMALTVRAVRWATDALSDDDTTVSALARHLGVEWHTAWDAIKVEAKARVYHPTRLGGVTSLGVDEHLWRPSRIGADGAVTIMVDLTRDQARCLPARLLNAVVGRFRHRLQTMVRRPTRRVHRRCGTGGT
jgi:transposase